MDRGYIPMKCSVANDCYGDIIEVPNINSSWFYGVIHDTSAFVEWLNNRVIWSKYAPAVIVESNLAPDACPDGMIQIFF